MPRTQHHYDPDYHSETPPVGFIDGLIIMLTILFSWLLGGKKK